MADVPITVTIPEAQVDRAVTALCGHFNYDRTKLEGETENQFALRKAKELMMRALKGSVMMYEDRQSKPADLPLG